MNRSALSFNGTSSFAEFNDKSKLPVGATARTVMFWVKPKTDAINQVVLSYGEKSSLKEFTIWLNGTRDEVKNKVMISAYDNAINTTNDVLVQSEWVHVAFVYGGGALNSTNTKIYINGVVAPFSITTGFTGTGTLNTTNVNAFIGKRVDDTSFLDAEIDELSIWNVALTETLVNEYKGKVLEGTETNLVHYYRFEEGQGSLVQDKTVNKNHLVLSNTTFISASANLTSTSREHDIAFSLDLSKGTYLNCEFKDEKLQLIPTGFDLSDMPYFQATGVYESEVVIAKDKFKSFKNVILNGTIDGVVKVYTKSSVDNITWSEYQEIDGNKNVLSPNGRYFKVKIEILPNKSDKTFSIDDFTDSSTLDSKFVECIDGELRLKKSYTEQMIANTGNIKSLKIERSKFILIDSLSIEVKE